MQQLQANEQTIPKLVIKKIIHAKRDRVFEAWRNPALMRQWLIPADGSSGKTNIDFRVGGKYQQEMILGSAGSTCNKDGTQGEVLLHEGEYLEILPPEKLVFTWNSPAVQNTRVTVELRDLDGSTELWLTHELLPTEAARKSHNGGWESCLANLERVVTSN